jgi:hypothetical protein
MATYGSIKYSGVEDAGIVGSGTTAYANTTDLPTSEVTTGAMAYVSANNKLYMWNGTAWFNIAIVNQAPTAITGNQATYVLATDGTPTVVTLVSTDPEGFRSHGHLRLLEIHRLEQLQTPITYLRLLRVQMKQISELSA